MRLFFLPIGLIASMLGAATSPVEVKLQHELLAPCCYQATLDQHMSDAALTMKTEIHEMVSAGRSEREIIDFYKARYGARILGEPEGAVWWIGTLTPLLALAASALVLTRLIRRWARSGEPAI